MYDVIVVGAGSAGCVVARRLADGGRRVALLEAGPGWPDLPSLTTPDAVAALAENDRFWPGVTATPAGGAAVPYRIGRGVGGGSAVNTLVATPGDRECYDRWERELGCCGWRWSTMEPWFLAALEQLRPEPAEPGPLSSALRAAARAAGHPIGGSSAEPDRSGFLAAAVTVAGKRRRSSAEAYLRSVPEALDLRAAVGVRRVLLRGRRATGVELDDGSDLAAGLVVLSAGALNTPALLASSGIALGRPRQGGGQSHGEVAIEDHPSFTFTVGLREGARQPVEPVVPISGLLRWSSSGWDAVGCDLMALVMDHVGVGEAGRRHGAVIVVLTGARSTGRLSTGASRTEFDPGWLDRPGDRERFRTGVRHVGELLGSEALAPVADGVFLDDRGTPLAALAAMSDLDLDRWLRRHPGPVSHAAASTRLGAGSTPGALLTGDGGVAGVDRLHVVDASVLPHLPSANPHLPVVAVAERLAAGLPS